MYQGDVVFFYLSGLEVPKVSLHLTQGPLVELRILPLEFDGELEGDQQH